MNVDAVLARFSTRPDDSWRATAARIGVPYRRLLGWRERQRIPSDQVQLLLNRARVLRVSLAPGDFFGAGDDVAAE